MQINKNPRLKSKKITDSARGEDCTLRISGVCNSNPETVVFCHYGKSGVALKPHDIHGCYGCSDCHDWLDNRVRYKKTPIFYDNDDRYNDMLRAMIETQSILIQKGLIKI